MAFPKLVLLALATLASTVSADHVVRIKNSCPFSLTPVYKGNHDNPNATRAPTIAAGGTGSFTLPEIWESGRIFPQDPNKTCLEPDGAKCTLAECSFGQPDSAGNKWWQCNISLVSGYNIPTSLGYIGGKDQSCNKVFKCLKPNCQSTEAYLVGDGAASCKNCISQCNTPNVGIAIEWCPPGSVIPDMGQGSNNGSDSGTPTKPPVSTPSKPEEDDDEEEEEPTKTPAFPSTPSNDAATKPPTNNIVDTTPKPSPKKCPASRLERQAARKTKRMEKRGKLHFVGHYMPKHGSAH